MHRLQKCPAIHGFPNCLVASLQWHVKPLTQINCIKESYDWDTRPGGRTARTKEAVFEAVAALIASARYEIAMTDIAERAGRSHGHRRWGDIRVLVMEVAVKELMRDIRCQTPGAPRNTRRLGVNIAKASAAARLLLPRVDHNYDASRDSRTARAAALTPRAAQSSRCWNVHGSEAKKRHRRPTCGSSARPALCRALFGSPADEAFAETLVERLLTR